MWILLCIIFMKNDIISYKNPWKGIDFFFIYYHMSGKKANFCSRKSRKSVDKHLFWCYHETRTNVPEHTFF